MNLEPTRDLDISSSLIYCTWIRFVQILMIGYVIAKIDIHTRKVNDTPDHTPALPCLLNVRPYSTLEYTLLNPA